MKVVWARDMGLAQNEAPHPLPAGCTNYTEHTQTAKERAPAVETNCRFDGRGLPIPAFSLVECCGETSGCLPLGFGLSRIG